MSGNDEVEFTPEMYNTIQEQFKLQSEVLAEAFILIYKSGLLDNMSQTAREYLASQDHISKAIAEGEAPSLEPRLTLKEYVTHIVNILDVPQSQVDFTSHIIQVCYVMIMSEKNPLIAQELRGVLGVNTALKEIINRR